MRPDDNQRQPIVRAPNRDAAYSLVPDRETPASARSASSPQSATANLVRQQIDAIYSDDPNAVIAAEVEPASGTITSAPSQNQSEPQQTPVSPASPTSTPILQGKSKFQSLPSDKKDEKQLTDNPYERTYSESELSADNKEWKQYHTAWQQYYQQYFHQYYAGHIQQMQATIEKNQSQTQSQTQDEITPEQAMEDIRSSIRKKIQDRTKSVRKSRHFAPLVAAACVMLVFAFLQYNQVLFANVNAYIIPSSLDPSNLIIDPIADTRVGPEPKLVIPKVNIDVPVVWDTTPDHASQMKAMEQGVAWFGIPGANSKPGQIGNTVLSGHSSNDFLESGNYKFVFAPLHRVVKGDTIYINYESTRYTYTVTDIKVVQPTDVESLRYHTDKPVLTLITCTPLGTAQNRLLVTAEQILPSPTDAAPAPSSDDNNGAAPTIPGSQPTVIERMFGR